MKKRKDSTDKAPGETPVRETPEEAPEEGERAQAASDDAVAIIERERDEYLQLARRARADYVNLQRRMESQASSVRDAAVGRFALDILAALDDLELALEHAADGEDYDGLVEGLVLVRSKFLSVLERYDIAPVEAEGKLFDHDFHDAVAEEPSATTEAGRVVTVIQKGYTMGGKLLRPARVTVAGKPKEPEEPGE